MKHLKRGDKMTLGERMLHYRARHNLSQRQLDRLLGISTHSTYKIENGVNKLRKTRKIFIESKMKELEEKENV